MTKLYLAGAMRNHYLYNHPAFDAAARDLRAVGFDVVNPAEIDRKLYCDPTDFPPDYDWDKLPPGFDLDACALNCIKELTDCDGIFMLRGWQESKGATAELAFARWTGKLVLFQ